MFLKFNPNHFVVGLFILILCLLSGCVSIPLTEGGTIAISTDGVTINRADTELEDATNGTPVEAVSEDVEVTPASTEVESTEGAENQQEMEVNEEGFGGCANEFYLIVNRLPKEFPIPPCVYIRHFELVEDQQNHERMLVAHYEDHGLVEEAHEKYKTFFEDAGFDIEQESVQGGVTMFLASGNGMDITLSNEQSGSDELRTEFVYSETPIKKYKIVESFINWTEDGYGKCTDEYYTALSLFPLGFPIIECAQVTLLQIEAYDEVIQGSTSYIVDRYWTEELEAFESYAQSEGYTILNNEGLATTGELELENDEYWMNITTTKLNMEQTETMINVTYKISMY